MIQNDTDVVTAVQFLAEAEQAHDELTALDEETANSWTQRRLRADIGFALKAAEVQALIAIARGLPRPPAGPKVVHL